MPLGDLEIIEEHLGKLFMPGFGKSIVNKQLADIGISRDSYSRTMLNSLLNKIEKKVLFSFQGPSARDTILRIKKEIRALGG